MIGSDPWSVPVIVTVSLPVKVPSGELPISPTTDDCPEFVMPEDAKIAKGMALPSEKGALVVVADREVVCKKTHQEGAMKVRPQKSTHGRLGFCRRLRQ